MLCEFLLYSKVKKLKPWWLKLSQTSLKHAFSDSGNFIKSQRGETQGKPCSDSSWSNRWTPKMKKKLWIHLETNDSVSHGVTWLIAHVTFQTCYINSKVDQGGAVRKQKACILPITCKKFAVSWLAKHRIPEGRIQITNHSLYLITLDSHLYLLNSGLRFKDAYPPPWPV